MIALLLAILLTGPVDLSWKIYDDLTINGDAKMNRVKAKSLAIQGNLQFQNLAVSGAATLEGSVKGERGKFGSLHVKGAMSATFIDVSGEAEMEGDVSIHQGRFKNLTLSGGAIVLDTVEIETLQIKKGDHLTIKGKTIIRDAIDFQSGEGKITIEGGDVTIQGKSAR